MAHVTVVGATGRVGTEVVAQGLAAGHQITAFVRDPGRLRIGAERVRIAQGDVFHRDSLEQAIRVTDAVIMVVGADPLKPSTLVGDSVKAIVDAMRVTGVKRYLGVSGTAEMPKSLFGKVTVALMRRTPVRHAIRDHDTAFSIVRAANVEWTLAGCPYIKDGPARYHYKLEEKFPGGFKVIHPGDVAHFFVQELTARRYPNAIVGIWY